VVVLIAVVALFLEQRSGFDNTVTALQTWLSGDRTGPLPSFYLTASGAAIAGDRVAVVALFVGAAKRALLHPVPTLIASAPGDHAQVARVESATVRCAAVASRSVPVVAELGALRDTVAALLTLSAVCWTAEAALDDGAIERAAVVRILITVVTGLVGLLYAVTALGTESARGGTRITRVDTAAVARATVPIDDVGVIADLYALDFAIATQVAILPGRAHPSDL
jgi:hypothetical protein